MELQASPFRLTETQLSVRQMECASCVAHVQKAAMKIPGVHACQVNLARGNAVIQFDSGKTNPAAVAAAITDSGYPAALQTGDFENQRRVHQHLQSRLWLRRAMVGLILWFPLELTHWIVQLVAPHGHSWMDWAAFATATVAIVYVGRGFYRSAFKALLRGSSNMDTLIAMGATVAYGYSLIAWAGHLLGHWAEPAALYFMESTGLLALISLGHWLEARARDTAGRSIHELLTLAPAIALRLDESGQTHEVSAAEVKIGDRLLVRPGDRIPVDATVQAGRSAVDESMISGEPLPVLREAGSHVVAGTLNTDGRLTIVANRVGADTALAQIVKLVEKTQSAKPPVQRLADQIAAIFVPAVLVIAGITGFAWYAWGHAHGWPGGITWAAIANAVCSVLIIACPCALGLALPAALMVGSGVGARRGILIRDIDALQNAQDINTVVLDKTGTLTLGQPNVDSIVAVEGISQEEILRLAATAEQFSGHPLAKAIVARARSAGVVLAEPENFISEPGLGVVAEIADKTLLVGSDALLQKFGWLGDGDDSPAGTVVHIGEKNASGQVRRLGTIYFNDPVKPESKAAIAELQAMGFKTVLLTGDSAAAAGVVARLVNIDDVRAGVQPAQKAQVIVELQNHAGGRRGRIVMVGDGINDAAALAAADLGIAVGSGSDVAKETGSIILVSGNLHGVAAAIRLSRATMRTIRQNLFLAFIYNLLAIPLAALGLLNPLIAAGAMALSDLCVVGNALRLRGTNIDGQTPGEKSRPG